LITTKISKFFYFHIEENLRLHERVYSYTDGNHLLKYEYSRCEILYKYLELLPGAIRKDVCFDGECPLMKHKSYDAGPKNPTDWRAMGACRLWKKFRKWCKENDKEEIKSTFFSPYSQPGEGELKIFDKIREKNKIDPDASHIIYGRDTDCVLFALCQPEVDIHFVYREAGGGFRCYSMDDVKKLFLPYRPNLMRPDVFLRDVALLLQLFANSYHSQPVKGFYMNERILFDVLLTKYKEFFTNRVDSLWTEHGIDETTFQEFCQYFLEEYYTEEFTDALPAEPDDVSYFLDFITVCMNQYFGEPASDDYEHMDEYCFPPTIQDFARMRLSPKYVTASRKSA